MAQQGTIRRLDIAHLGLDKDHMPYSDGVACIQAYWAYSMDLTQDERNNMRNLIINLNYRHTLASREEFYEHHLCRDPAGRTRPGLVILRALYKVVPVDFENGVVARCGPLPVRNRSDEYFALFPDTIGPPVFDMDTGRARRYQQRYPLLKVTPSTLRNRDQAVLPAPQDTPSPTIPPASPNAISPVPASVMDTVFEEISASPLAILIPETLMQPPSTTTEANSPVTRQEFDQLCSEVATLAENVSMLQRAFERQRERR
ncbi:hypothetical protein THAR02_00937 [Trichoderma harzianum]|uniref:Uncharacterized protein n=1 Tax=Trichoderma harzianum TaxID=5544 RepID=A0A0G0A3W1_TRIHA|nr:hypothetical protein THAR02_00937 [Trichoderma harzianum]